MDIVYHLKWYRASNITSLLILETQASYTPGKMAKQNGVSGYGNWNNKSGYLHVEARPAMVEGMSVGVPVYKDVYPVNMPGVVTISSTYGIGLNLGYSFTNGFSLTNITVEETSTIGFNVSYSYSKSYTNSEPALSTQRASNNNRQYQWTYTYSSERNETNHLNTGYIFEMNNNHSVGDYEVTLQFNYKLTIIDDGIILGWGKKTQSFEGYALGINYI